jgi:CHAD domain-containing protein
MPVPTTRSELLKKRIDQFTRVVQAAEKGDPRALHQARVATRRIRELVPMLQLEGSAGRKLARRLRRVTGRLGTVRELDVLILLIDELHVAGRRATGALGRVGVRVAKARDHARRKLQAHIPIGDMSRLARKLGKIADRLKESERASSKSAARRWRWAIEARVTKRAMRLSAAMGDAGALYIPERLHNVRIAVKKLRYAVELSTEASNERGGADLRLLTRGQDLLGRMHDVQVLIDEVRQTQASLTPPSISVWRDLDSLIASLEDDCRRLHARYMRIREALGDVAARRSEASDPHATHAQARRAG